jgi:glycosyltransferase involved in cell wall biosynthesis
MRLLFWIPALGLAGGGAERVLSIVASGLAQRGHDVLVASADAAQTPSFYAFDPAVTRVRLGFRPGASWHPAALFRLRSKLRDFRPDAAVGFMFAGYATLAVAATRSKVPIVASEHTAFDHYRRRALQARLLRRMAPRFAAVTIPSERVRNGYPKLVADRMTVMPNPLAIAGSERRQSSRGGRKRLLAVGNLRAEKGHSVLIEAFARIAGSHPDWDLRIVGEGPLKSVLDQAIRDSGLDERATISGAVADIESEYRQADLFVMPSAYESFGLATAEALAAGVPAVGFADCPGTNDLVRDGINGLLVEGSDRPKELADGLGRLMGSPSLLQQFAADAPGTVADYAPEGIVRRWEELLQSVVSVGNARQ